MPDQPNNTPAPPRQPTHRLYVDEVGHAYPSDFSKDSERYLSIVGVASERKHINLNVVRELDELKRRYFYHDPQTQHPRDPDRAVVLHRSEMVRGNYPFDVLKDAEVRNRFNDELFSFLQNWEYTVFNVVVDKQELQASSSPLHPYHYAIEVLLEGYVLWLEERSALGDVMAEARGGREDRTLEQYYTEMYDSGTSRLTHLHIASCVTSRQLKLEKKDKNIAGLQIAEVLGQPCFQSAHGLKLTGRIPMDFSGKLATMLIEQRKYHCCPTTGNIDGFGRKWLPL
ncbi:MAG: DUF3800 domain-containing protein [Fibrella sp.]|nr:DUF3800 domain-containing protein [Armatimonadota bacterium]